MYKESLGMRLAQPPLSVTPRWNWRWEQFNNPWNTPLFQQQCQILQTMLTAMLLPHPLYVHVAYPTSMYGIHWRRDLSSSGQNSSSQRTTREPRISHAAVYTVSTLDTAPWQHTSSNTFWFRISGSMVLLAGCAVPIGGCFRSAMPFSITSCV